MRNTELSHRFSHGIKHGKVRFAPLSLLIVLKSHLREPVEVSCKHFKTAAFSQLSHLSVAR